MLRRRTGTVASSEDVVERETPHHRAADIPSLLRERVNLERDAVDDLRDPLIFA